VLDVGCGAGSAALELAANGYQAAGIDFAPKMIERARTAAEQRGLSVDFHVGSADSLDFPDGHFDAVIALGLLASLPDDRHALDEMRRVLKPDGWLMVTLPNLLALDRWLGLPRSLPILAPPRMRPLFRHVGNIARRLLRKPPQPITSLRYGRSGVPKRYRRHLQQNGFADLRYAAVSYGPIMPLGFAWFNQHILIRLSELLGRFLPNWMGSVIVFYGQRA
jgi:ubiquinone/menaquinone biosynthesis C-methylase UbiE